MWKSCMEMCCCINSWHTKIAKRSKGYVDENITLILLGRHEYYVYVKFNLWKLNDYACVLLNFMFLIRICYSQHRLLVATILCLLSLFGVNKKAEMFLRESCIQYVLYNFFLSYRNQRVKNVVILKINYWSHPILDVIRFFLDLFG